MPFGHQYTTEIRPLRRQNVGNGRWAGLNDELFAAKGSEDWLKHDFWGGWLGIPLLKKKGEGWIFRLLR